MVKRLLDYTPSEIIQLTKTELLDSIRASEGRTVCSYVCPRSANYVEKVSNIELAASFGADLVNLEGFNPYKLQMSGLKSKNQEEDSIHRKDLQVDMGFGWSIAEMRKLIGRPIGITLLVPEYEGQQFGPLFEEEFYSPSMIEHIVNEGYDFVALCTLHSCGNDTLIEAVRETKKIAGDKIIIESGIPHGPGAIMSPTWPPYNLREAITPEYAYRLAEAGADIVDIPAAGVVPGFSLEYVSKMADAVHSCNAIVGSCIAHSIEAADDNTISRIALNNKMCGADMFNIAAGGVYESITLPEALQAYCFAVKGKRHTYRRMCQSPLR